MDPPLGPEPLQMTSDLSPSGQSEPPIRVGQYCGCYSDMTNHQKLGCRSYAKGVNGPASGSGAFEDDD